VYVTGGTYNNEITVFTNNTGGTFSVSGFSTGDTSYWSAGSGTNAIVVVNSNSIASNTLALAEGSATTASGLYSHSEGLNTTATAQGAHSEGQTTTASGQASHAEGISSKAQALGAHSEGVSTTASSQASHAEGQLTTASGLASHAEGSGTTASGNYSHSEGNSSSASGYASHVEGISTTANNSAAHAEGYLTTASGTRSHSEGFQTTASGDESHAEGFGTLASGNSSHAGGSRSVASGATSFVHGSGSTAAGISTIVLGDDITGTTPNRVYVQRISILSGATAGYVLTSDANGDATWEPSSGSTGTTSGSVFTGGTVSGETIFTNGLTATTISASTYYNLPLDVYVTGGTYNNEITVFTNNTGGTFSVSGFSDSVKFNDADGVMHNGKIDVTVASNNITVALKTLAGTDPSASNPVYVTISGAVRTISSALSVTKNAGTNWFGNGLNFQVDYFTYLGYNAIDGVVIGFAQIIGYQYSSFSTTTTNGKYCAISDITNAVSTDPYVVIGRFAATLGVTASFNWSVPTYTPITLIQRPIYESRWLSYNVTTVTGFSGSPSIGISYRVYDSIVEYQATLGGTSNATTFTHTMPIAPITLIMHVGSYCVDNGVNQTAPCGMQVTGGGSLVFNIYKTTAYTAWTNAGTKQAHIIARYRY